MHPVEVLGDLPALDRAALERGEPSGVYTDRFHPADMAEHRAVIDAAAPT